MPQILQRACALAVLIFAGWGSSIAAPAVSHPSPYAVAAADARLIPVRDERDYDDDDDDEGPSYYAPRFHEPPYRGGYAPGYDERYGDDNSYRRFGPPRAYGYGQVPYGPAPLPPPPLPPAAGYDPGLLYAPPRPSSCGQYRYWNGDYCADARYERPYVGPRW